GTKMGGREGTKMGGREGTKMGGREGTKMGGREGTKMGGREGTKLGGGGGSGAFFDSFELFKNIETPWNLSGFTKVPKPTFKEKHDQESQGNTSA
ncbi:MAG: hypothetical protein KDB79_05730, partial [Acidobacteria bacterium]|nr:hypothetical protein [Acidobacteriota bacterium]